MSKIKFILFVFLFSFGANSVFAQNDPVEKSEDNEVFPEFPGGLDSLFKYMSQNMVYPSEAKENGVGGTVFVTFYIEKNGEISEIKALNSIGAGCDEEAVRLIEEMPNWKPGTQNGKPVRVKYNFPVKFTLGDGHKKKKSKKKKK